MKIYKENMKKILDKCTKKEIDLIIYLGQFQDEKGVIKGIEYKDVLKEVEICKSTFYLLIYSLEKKGIIKINYTHNYKYWEMVILNNEFNNSTDYKKGYFKLNFAVLHSKAFKQMTKSEKIIVINIINLNFNREFIKVSFNKIRLWTGKSLRSCKKFIETIRNVFNLTIKNGTIIISTFAGFENNTKSEKDILNRHLITYKLKKGKNPINENDIKDVLILIKQYGKIQKDKIFDVIESVIDEYGMLIPKLINTKLQHIT